MAQMQSPWLGFMNAKQPLMRELQYNWKNPNQQYPMVAEMQPEFPAFGIDQVPDMPAQPAPLPQETMRPEVAQFLAEQAADAPQPMPRNTTLMSDADYLKLMERINQSGLESIAMQKEGVKGLEQNISDFKSLPNQLDLTPLAALVDQWSGSNLVKSYKAPTSPEERMRAIQQMEQAVQKARQGVSASDLELLQRQLQNRTALEDRAARREDAALRRAEAEAQRLERQGIRANEKRIEWGTAWQKDVGNRMTGVANFASNLKKAKDIINKHRGPPPIGSEDFKLYQSAISQAITNYNRDVALLGALAGADLGLLENATGAQMNAISDRIFQQVKGGYEGTVRSMEELLKASDKAIKNLGSTTNLTYGGLLDDLYENKRQQYDEMVNPDAKQQGAGFTMPSQDAIQAALAKRQGAAK